MPDLKGFRRRFKKLNIPADEQSRRVDAMLRKANNPKPVGLKEFNRQLSKATKDLPAEALSEVQRALTFDLLRRVVEKTPVDTGRARGNWQVGVNRIPTKVYKSVRRNPIEAGDAALSEVPQFATTYVANNVEYIVFLEEGSSPEQAPNGMLAISIEELLENFA